MSVGLVGRSAPKAERVLQVAAAQCSVRITHSSPQFEFWFCKGGGSVSTTSPPLLARRSASDGMVAGTDRS